MEWQRFENRRRYPRIVLDYGGSLLLPGINPIHITVHDLSTCAIQALFDAGTERTIRTVLHQGNIADFPPVNVSFTIEIHNQAQEINVRCKPVYIAQLGNNIYAMGLQFSDLEGRYQALINKFVEVSMEPV